MVEVRAVSVEDMRRAARAEAKESRRLQKQARSKQRFLLRTQCLLLDSKVVRAWLITTATSPCLLQHTVHVLSDLEQIRRLGLQRDS